jgi:hypothetical protein
MMLVNVFHQCSSTVGLLCKTWSNVQLMGIAYIIFDIWNRSSVGGISCTIGRQEKCNHEVRDVNSRRHDESSSSETNSPGSL